MGAHRRLDPNRLKGIALVLSASALWGASGSLTKILRLHGFDLTDILAWRYLIGLASLMGFSRILPKPPSLRIDATHLRTALWMALCILGTNAAFTWSNFLTTVANAVTLSFTAPLFAAVLAWLFLGEKVRAFHQLAIGIGFLGVCLFALSARSGTTATPTALSPNIPLGDGLALLSGLLFGWYFVLARRYAQQDGDVMAATVRQFLILALLLSPLAARTLFQEIARWGWLALAVYSTLCTAAPILMLNLSGLFLGAHEASILALSEVPFSILIGMITLGEFPSLPAWAGVGLILVAGLLAGVRQG